LVESGQAVACNCEEATIDDAISKALGIPLASDD
jgi:hypothetical protein